MSSPEEGRERVIPQPGPSLRKGGTVGWGVSCTRSCCARSFFLPHNVANVRARDGGMFMGR